MFEIQPRTFFVSLTLNIIKSMYIHKWRPPSLSELTPYEISLELAYLGSEASIYVYIFKC